MAGTADQGARDFVRRATRRPEDRFKPRVPVTGSSGAGGGVLGTDSGARNAAGWITLADPLPTCTETLRGAVRVETPSGSPDDFCVCEDTTGSGAWDWVCASASGGGAVSSVNGLTGAVVLDADDIDDTSTVNKFVAAADLAKLAGIEAGADVTDAGNVGTAIDGAAAKTTPVDADTMPLIDSAASNVLKKVSWANIKATLKTYFDTLYSAIGHVHDDPTIVIKLDTVNYNTATKHLDFQGNSAGGTNTTWDLATATDEVDVGLERGTEHFNVPYGDHVHTAGAGAIAYGPVASLPAAGNAGAAYSCSDTPLVLIDTGSEWALWDYPSRPLTFPVSGDFAWQNQGTASIDTSMGGVRLSVPIGAGANWRMRLKAYPSPPFTVTVFLDQMPPGVSHISSGIVLFDGTKVISFGQYVNQNTNTPQDVVALSKWTAVNAFSADYESQHQVNGRMPSWFRFTDDNTNRIFEYSYDGHHWIRRNHLTITRTDFLTPTHIGFGGNHEQNSGSPHIVWLLSWLQT